MFGISSRRFSGSSVRFIVMGRPDQTRGDGVHVDPLWREFEREAAGEGQQAAFGGPVGGVHRAWDGLVHRGDVQYLSAGTSGLATADELPAAEERTVEICPDHLVELFSLRLGNC